MSTRRRTSGFTLLELLMVIGIAGVVTTLALSAFIGMTDSWRAVSARTDLDRKADTVFDDMRQSFASVVDPTLSGIPLKGTDKTYQAPAEYVASTARNDDEVEFATRLPLSDGKQSAGAIVTYYVNHDQNEGSIRRIQRQLNGRPDDKAAAEIIPGVNVFWFDVQYAGADGKWVNEWSQPVLPVSVRVEMTLQDPATGEQVIRQAIIPVHVG